MTLGGVERLGAEVDIPARYVKAAAEEVNEKATSGLAVRSKAATVMVRRVPRAVDPASYPALVEEMAATVGHQGLVSTLGRELRWRMVAPGELPRDLMITICRGDGETVITIEEKNKDLRTQWNTVSLGAAGTVGSILIAAIAAKKLGSATLAILGPVLWLMFCAWIARFGFGRQRAEREAELEGLMDRLVRGIEEYEPSARGAEKRLLEG